MASCVAQCTMNREGKSLSFLAYALQLKVKTGYCGRDGTNWQFFLIN